MNMFQIDYKKKIFEGAALCCAASLLTACSRQIPEQGTAPAPAGKMISSALSVYFPGNNCIQTAVMPAIEPEPVSSCNAPGGQASIRILSYSGTLGDYSFQDCNETQLFGDYTLTLASFEKEEYLMLSRDQIALLAKEDGSDAKLFYQGKCLSLPSPCYFNIGCNLIELYEGDFLGSGGRQLALIIPVENGSGIYIEKLSIIDLDTMSLVPMYCDDPSCKDFISEQFASHFAAGNMDVDYHVYDYIHYAIYKNQILVTYGASDAEENYLCFFSSNLTVENGFLKLGQLRFWDNFY